MGKVLVIPNADFSNVKSRKIITQPVVIDTVYENSYFHQNGDIITDVAGKTAADYPAVHLWTNNHISTNPWAVDLMLAQVEIPEGAVAVGGVSNTFTYMPSSNSTFNAIPIAQRDANANRTTQQYGSYFMLLSSLNFAPDDETFITRNVAADGVCETLRILAKAEGISQGKNSMSRLIEFVAKINPDAKYLDLSWVRPRSVTATYAVNTIGAGNSTLGVGMVKPDLYWIFE